MPSRAPRRCTRSGCPHQMPCPVHTVGWSRSQRKAELPADWPHIRQAVLERDHYRCVWCGASATDVDHIDDPHDHRPANLRSLCGPCHDRRTAQQGVAARLDRGR